LSPLIEIFKLPFTPAQSFKKLQFVDNKWRIIFVYFTIIVTAYGVGFSLKDSPELFSISFPVRLSLYCLGIADSFILYGIVIEIISSKTFKHKINIKNGLLLVAATSLPSLIGLILSVLLKTPLAKAVSINFSSIITTIYIGIGLHHFYNKSMLKSQFIAFFMLLISMFMEVCFYGIEL